IRPRHCAVDIGKTASDRLIEFIEIVEDLVAEVPEYFGVGDFHSTFYCRFVALACRAESARS
ncbi:hypothetical protein ACL1HB_14275, partial [Corynebacterium striatum]